MTAMHSAAATLCLHPAAENDCHEVLTAFDCRLDAEAAGGAADKRPERWLAAFGGDRILQFSGTGRPVSGCHVSRVRLSAYAKTLLRPAERRVIAVDSAFVAVLWVLRASCVLFAARDLVGCLGEVAGCVHRQHGVCIKVGACRAAAEVRGGRERQAQERVVGALDGTACSSGAGDACVSCMSERLKEREQQAS